MCACVRHAYKIAVDSLMYPLISLSSQHMHTNFFSRTLLPWDHLMPNITIFQNDLHARKKIILNNIILNEKHSALLSWTWKRAHAHNRVIYEHCDCDVRPLEYSWRNIVSSTILLRSCVSFSGSRSMFIARNIRYNTDEENEWSDRVNPNKRTRVRRQQQQQPEHDGEKKANAMCGCVIGLRRSKTDVNNIR